MPGKESSVSLLAIDDDPATLDLVKEALSSQELDIFTADSPEAGLELFLRIHPRIVLMDLMMPVMSGMDVLERILANDPAAEVILMSAHYSTDSAVEAIQKGARDYLTKPLDLEKLRGRITSLLAEVSERSRASRLDLQLLDTFQFEGMIGRSPLLLDVVAKIRRIAPHFRTALVSGETGTGKELVARALHRLSPASSGPFAVCNCAAVVETLFESELFGYVRGAFTGATQDKVGLMEYANGGAVFLDEIGEMPLATQAKLLRVLQNHEIQRVGSPAIRKVDVRVIAATNRDLRALTKEGKFREDLYYRLGTIEIVLPRLADRKEDLPLLERYFVENYATQYKKKINGITRRAQALMATYSWPGNIRELDNVIGLAAMMIENNVIDIMDLPEALRMQQKAPSSERDDLISIEELQQRHLQRVLQHVGGEKTKAAEILGISRTTLYNLLSRAKSSNAPAVALDKDSNAP
jgi:DNA-binding NtrC family response regulator